MSPGVADQAPSWVSPVARLGYAAKGVVYAVIGVLAFQLAIGSGGGTEGSRGALREIASGPFGQIALGLVALGLVGYVGWRLVQAFVDPEADGSDGTGKRLAKRAFYLLSAVLYGALAVYAVDLVMTGSGGGSGGGSRQSRVAWLMGREWGVWLLGAIGVAVIVRGLLQFWKAYTESFREKIQSFDLGPARRSWVLAASRLGITARGVVFAVIGGFLVWAAVTHDPSRAVGLEGALDVLRGNRWILGGVGAGLVGYAVYQWVKARYRLIGVG